MNLLVSPKTTVDTFFTCHVFKVYCEENLIAIGFSVAFYSLCLILAKIAIFIQVPKPLKQNHQTGSQSTANRTTTTKTQRKSKRKEFPAQSMAIDKWVTLPSTHLSPKSPLVGQF